MDKWEEARLNDLMRTTSVQAARMRPIRFSIQKIRAMSDEEIMSILSGEAGIEGTLYHDTLHLLSTELNRREIQRASKPHWTTVPAFWLTVVAAAGGVAGVVATVVVAFLQSK